MHDLVRLGTARYREAQEAGIWNEPVQDEGAKRYYNNIDEYPHIFVLGCLMDRGVKAEKACGIPYSVCKLFDAFDMESLSAISSEEIREWFAENRPHRFNEKMAEVFYAAVQHIHSVYDDDASAIWSGRPGSAEVICRFLEFRGAGVKIATMATNILTRDYRVELKDRYAIDVSPDIHVRRIFYRLGLIPDEDNREMVIYKARELNLEFPGIVDLFCWETGKNYCHPKNPKCVRCPLNSCCEFGKR